VENWPGEGITGPEMMVGLQAQQRFGTDVSWWLGN
jgi:hypothetical protein